MAIFQKAYRGYEGPLTPGYERILVVFRYALADAFRSRLFAGFFFASFLPSLALLCTVYVYHNIELLMQFDGMPDALMPIDGEFFYYLMQLPYTFILFVLVVGIGPTMISPDIRNNAMSLYLSRPVSRASYIFGKFLVLLFVGSLITWIPGLLIILFQAFLAGGGWLGQNLYIPFGIVVSSLVWLTGLSLLAFAISAWVKWKAMARLIFFGILSLGSAVGGVARELTGGWGGHVFDLIYSMEVIEESLMQVSDVQIMPLQAALGTFLLVSALAVGILLRRLRAFQVVT